MPALVHLPSGWRLTGLQIDDGQLLLLHGHFADDVYHSGRSQRGDQQQWGLRHYDWNAKTHELLPHH